MGNWSKISFSWNTRWWPYMMIGKWVEYIASQWNSFTWTHTTRHKFYRTFITGMDHVYHLNLLSSIAFYLPNHSKYLMKLWLYIDMFKKSFINCDRSINGQRQCNRHLIFNVPCGQFIHCICTIGIQFYFDFISIVYFPLFYRIK